MEAKINYGCFKKGNFYPIVSEGLDWYLMKVGGKAIYAFKWVFTGQDKKVDWLESEDG